MIIKKVHDPLFKTFPTYRRKLVKLREANQKLNLEVRTTILKCVVTAVMRRGKLGKRGASRDSNCPVIAMYRSAYSVQDAIVMFIEEYGTEYLPCFETIWMAHDGCVAREGNANDYIMILQYFIGVSDECL